FAGFSGGTLALPSFGFIVGFIPAAALIGWLSERSWDRKFPLALGGFLLASAIPFVVGLPYLAISLAHLGLPHDFAAVMAAGFTPFIVGGIAKWLIAAGALPLLWRASRALKRR
ncbi:MAG: BioY protein, partial [Frondihabitans sp.]|nr:BioY protein [Frondihabitans sp.]